MPKFSFKYSKGKRRKKGKGKYRQQMLSTNTVSKIATKVAKIEAAKTRINLIKRNFLFPGAFQNGQDPFVYDKNINEFGPGLPLHWTGRIVELSRIRHVDIATVANAVVQDDPLTQAEENTIAAQDGTNVLMSVQSPHGRRSSNQVKITGVSLHVKASCKRLLDDATESGYDSLPLMGATEIRYAVIAWRSDNPQINQTGAGDRPRIEYVLPWKTFGYSSKLDVTEERTHHDTKYKTLLRGTMRLNPQGNGRTQREKSQFVRFKDPILINYEDFDQEGMEPTNWKIFAVFRSNVPFVANGLTQGDYTAALPKVLACSKLFYYEP